MKRNGKLSEATKRRTVVGFLLTIATMFGSWEVLCRKQAHRAERTSFWSTAVS